METRRISISRAARQAEFPADFQLVAAMNPCKCGYANDPDRACTQCGPKQIERYQRRISGPLRDRIDIQIEVPALSHEQLLDRSTQDNETSAIVRQRVTRAWQTQLQRQGCSNAGLDQQSIRRHCGIGTAGERLLATAIERLGLSARAFHRILKVARTIADLDECETIAASHLTEAISYRRLDRT